MSIKDPDVRQIVQIERENQLYKAELSVLRSLAKQLSDISKNLLARIEKSESSIPDAARQGDLFDSASLSPSTQHNDCVDAKCSPPVDQL